LVFSATEPLRGEAPVRWASASTRLVFPDEGWPTKAMLRMLAAGVDIVRSSPTEGVAGPHRAGSCIADGAGRADEGRNILARSRGACQTRRDSCAATLGVHRRRAPVAASRRSLAVRTRPNERGEPPVRRLASRSQLA